MDAPDVDVAALQADLAAWGALEPDHSALTRRARAGLARAAAHLRDAEVAGRKPPGHPMVEAARLALDDLAPPGAATMGHARILAAVELASLPDSVRDLLSGS
jgi:hypothetical protein